MDLQLAAAAAKIYETLDTKDPEQRADLAVMLARRLSGKPAARQKRARSMSAQRRAWLEALRPVFESTAHLTCERAAEVLTAKGHRSSRGNDWTSSSVWNTREQLAKLGKAKETSQ